MVRLGDIATVITKGTTPTSVGFQFQNTGVNFIRIESITEDGTFLPEKFGHIDSVCNEALKRSQLRNNDILFSIAGAIGRTAIVNESILPANTNQALAIIRIPEGVVNYKFILYALQAPSVKEQFSMQKQGVAQLNISLKNVSDFKVPMVSICRQEHIVAVLDSVNHMIALRKQQLAKLDELVKARFVEMFGDPVSNCKGLPTEAMTKVCAIIDGDRGKNYPKQEEFYGTGYCLFLNAKNVTATGFSFENCMYISEEKDNALHNGKLERGDVVLTTRGTLGNLAFYDREVPFENVRINSGMVILRMNREVISEVFFIEQFKLQLQTIKGKIASGSAQPQLPISTMNKIQILIAPMELQERFSSFVAQIDKSKLTIQQSLDKLEMLKKALMQKYFG